MGRYLAIFYEELQSVFRMRAFALFSIGNFSSLMGIWMVRICIAWLTWEMTHSKSWLGVMAFAELGPSVFISLLAGPLADSQDRWKVLRFGQTIQACLGLALVVLVLTNALTVWWMFWILIGFSIIGGMNLPARMSIAPSLVPRDKLATASAIGSMTFNSTRLLGPLLAAPLLVYSLELVAFMIATLGFMINAYSLSRVREQDLSGTPGETARKDSDLGYGAVIKDILRDRALAIVLLLQFIGSLLVRPIADMFPAFADQVFGKGEHGFALLSAALGIGAILGAVLVVGNLAGRAMRNHILVGTLFMAVSGIIFSFIDFFWLALFVLVLNGAALTTCSVASTTFVQLRTPTERLGRVMSLYGIIFRLAPALGALGLGLAADAWSLKGATAVSAALAAILILLYWRPLSREMKHQEETRATPT